jgi:hypothetical protein
MLPLRDGTESPMNNVRKESGGFGSSIIKSSNQGEFGHSTPESICRNLVCLFARDDASGISRSTTVTSLAKSK